MLKVYVIENWLNKIDICLDKDIRSLMYISSLFKNMDIIKDERGKPYLLNSNNFINWSHNEKYLVIGIGSSNLGLDIEFSNIEYDESLYGWILHKNEKDFINTNGKFSEIWTRKESILKCSGEGLIENLYDLNSLNEKYNISYFEYNDLSISICTDIHINRAIEILPI